MEFVNDVDGRIILFKKWLPETKTFLDHCTTLKTKLYPFKLKQQRLMYACGDPGVFHEFRDVAVDIHEWSLLVC